MKHQKLDEGLVDSCNTKLPALHPDFAHPDANIVLVAKDARVHFRIHQHTLRTTSGFFRTMFSLPQSASSPIETLYLDEDQVVLEHLLRMISGLPILDIGCHELLQSLLHTAEKYEMPGPISILRLYVMTPSQLDADVIRLYACARRYGWDKEAKHFSFRTLKLNIYDTIHRPSLSTLSPEAMLDLFLLHRGRKVLLRQKLDNAPFVTGDASRCAQCDTPISYQTWRELKHRILMEVDERPLGDTVLDPGLMIWPEAQATWKAACPKEECKRLLYDRAETVRVITKSTESLPQTV